MPMGKQVCGTYGQRDTLMTASFSCFLISSKLISGECCTLMTTVCTLIGTQAPCSLWYSTVTWKRNPHTSQVEGINRNDVTWVLESGLSQASVPSRRNSDIFLWNNKIEDNTMHTYTIIYMQTISRNNCLYLNSIHSKMGYISQYLVIVSTVVTLTDTVQHVFVFTYHAHIHNNLYANHKQKQLLVSISTAYILKWDTFLKLSHCINVNTQILCRCKYLFSPTMHTYTIIYMQTISRNYC